MDDVTDARIKELKAGLTEQIKVARDTAQGAEESIAAIFNTQIDYHFGELCDNVSRLYNADIQRKARRIAITVINELANCISE